MKTVLWATLTANGNYAQSSPEHPPKPEAFGDFVAQVREAGNFIVGRRTFENMAAGGNGPFGDVDIVVVSQKRDTIPGATVVSSPREALAYLSTKSYQTALVGAGADLHNAFLSQGLVDELIFNIAPVLEGKGLNLLLDQNQYQYRDVQLLGCQPLGGGVIQLRYAFSQA